jgi:CheY-like chemotaxis protein
MAKRIKKDRQEEGDIIHQYYMDIINGVPQLLYWIDTNCSLKGCNRAFVDFFEIKQLNDFYGTPYEKMEKGTKWSKERIDAFRLDDMKVLFSQEPQHNIEEPPVTNNEGTPLYFLSTRTPLFDHNKQVIGVVVVLTDITDRKRLEKLEARAVQETKDPKSQAADETLGREPNVLMVEDNFVAQKIEEALLKELHCHVDIAESGDRALQLFNPGKYDIVLMDISLEDTSGYIVAKKFRQKEENTLFHVPIIALTSYKADVVKYDCKDYFMDGVITKPLTSEQAQQIIQRFIYHKDIFVTGLETVAQNEI